ncbi:MAG: type II toxin-antitoxin system PemK/MazF family toxin [Planctomycetes bacterium]|nr:type II toxin-antitoxin system PemK/MazF family toxin [Planctomycetota bacterium]
MKRGDVVLVYVPFVGRPGGKIRPAVVVQSDPLNSLLRETVIAEITSNLTHAAKPHQVLVDISTPDGGASGLLTDSAVRCERIHTVPQRDVARTIGDLSRAIMLLVDKAMKAALGIA